MRFSLGWLFAVTTYAAIIAAAVATGKGWFVDIVWLISALALCYAILVSLTSAGRRRAIALGFVVFATANLTAWIFFPNRTPVMLGMRAVGYGVLDDGSVYIVSPDGQGLQRAASGEPAIRVANGAGILLAGLFGCLAGQVAYVNGLRPNVRSSDG
jgi:hypothetical protein